jgi:predicted acetyltransferase
MTPDFAMRPLAAETRPILEHLWQLYRHDLSEFRGTHGPSGFRGMLPGEDGKFHARSLMPFFHEDADRAAYLFYCGASPVGFALVSHLTSWPRLMSEFFIVRGLRRHGVGRAAVGELFALHPGMWEIPFQEDNVAAARFWRRVAASVDGDGFHEERRPVPDKPEVPPDVWITVTVG